MSYYYNDNGCNLCNQATIYTQNKDLTNYSCDQPCLCRFNEERTSKDKMYYNWFVLNQPVNIPSGNDSVLPQPQSNCPK